MHSTNGHGPASGAERIALYLRVSSEEQRDRETIEIQRQFLEEYCKLYGLEVVEVYEDDGVSGTVPLHERPEGRRLLEDARAKKFDTVIVYKLDRLGRTLMVIVDAHDRLETASASLRSAREPVDTSNPSGRLIFQMLASFAEYDRENIKERTTAGIHRAYRNGKHMGRIPYGYRVNAEGAFEVVDPEAEIVVEIITNLADHGSTLYAEAKRLNDQCIPSPGWRYGTGEREPGRSWSATTVANIVHQRAYSGTHRVKIKGGKELIEREVPAVVSVSLQERAEAMLAENKRYPKRGADRNYLLAGLVRCGVCGYALTGRTSTARGKRYCYYACIYGRKTEKHHSPYLKASWLEELVWDDCRWFLHNPGEVLERVKEQMENKDESGGLEERHASLTKRLATKQAEKDRYVKLYAAGHLDEKELDTYLADIRNQVENLKLLISSVEADLSHVMVEKELVATTEAWLMSLRANLDAVEADTDEAFYRRRELVKLLVAEITDTGGEDGTTEVRITYRFGPPGQGPGAEDAEARDMFVGGELNSRR